MGMTWSEYKAYREKKKKEEKAESKKIQQQNISSNDNYRFGMGNIDLTNRPIVKNNDGSISTVRSMSFNENGKEILVPTVVNGRIVSDIEAINHYHKTGEYLGKFNTIKEADDYAQKLHEQQEQMYTRNQNKTNPIKETFSPILSTSNNNITSNTLQDIINKNNTSKLATTNNNPIAKVVEEKNTNKPLQKAIEEQKKKPKTTQKEPSTWERIMDNFRIGGYGGITGVAQTGYRDIRDIDNMYTDASSLMRHQVLSTFFGEHGENFARAVDDKLYKWNNDRNQFYNYALDVLNKEQQTNKQNIQQNIEAVKQSGDKVGTKFAELAPSVGNNAMGLLAGTVNPALAFTYYKGSSEASYYDDALQRGMTEDQAKVYSKLMSYVEAGTETISAGNILKGGKAIKAVASGAKNIGVKEGLKAGFNVFKESAKEETANALKQGLKSYGIGIAEEFFQEAITEPIQEFTAMKVAGEDKADWNNMWQRMLQSGVDGALSSAILAGANMGISSCQGIVTKVQNGQEFTTEEYNTAIKDASEKVDVGKMTTDGIKNQVEKLKTEMQQSQNGVNKDINQEIKTSQNGFSQAEKTEALRQEARNKLESIKQNYDENSYNQMQEFIETAPNEKALNQVISDLNKETETKQVAPLKQKQEVQLPMQQTTQNKSFEDVAFEAMNNYESNEVESPLKNRDMDSIGKQTKVNAYQYDNPKVKPYFQEMAQQMGEDLAYIASPENRSTKKGGGTKLSTSTKAMDILHNEQGYSYDQIAKGLQNIIDDKGSENNAISKKIELVIDEQLRNGYTNALGRNIEPNQDYINTINQNKEAKLQNNSIDSFTQNSFNGYTEKEINNIKSNKISIANNNEDIINFAKKSREVPGNFKMYLGKIQQKASNFIKNKLGINVEGYNISLKTDDVRKVIKDHGSEETELPRGQVPITESDFANIPDIINNPDSVEISGESPQGKPVIKFEKNIDGNNVVVTYVSDKHHNLELQTMYKFKNNKKTDSSTALHENQTPGLNTSEMDSGMNLINNSIPQNEQNVKSDNTNINNMQNNQENMQQFSMSEQQKQNNFEYKESKNSKVDTFRKDASKYWDNSEKTNKLVNTIEKVINDKGYNIRLDDTLGDNVNGRIVTNNQTGEIEITLNPNSSRTGEFILGHELTHAIQTQEMIDLVNDRMTKDGDLRNAVEDLKKLYGTDDINAEVLADISGQLFGTQEFINNLSVEKPSVFKRIYDTIVSLANKITGNSNEALFIKDLKNKWEKAYRENTNKITNAEYSLNKDGAMKDNKTGKKVILQAESMNDGKNLLAIHNLDESKLKGVLELGGFPVPSIAITNPDVVGHSQFGDISVIFNKNTINPENRANEVYDRDVWSPTVPEINYDINNDNIKEYITKNIDYNRNDSIINDAITSYMYESNLADLVNRRGIDNALKTLKESNSLKYFYKTSVEKGDYKPVMKQANFSNSDSYGNEELQQFLNEYKGEKPLNELSYQETLDLSDTITDIIQEKLNKEAEKLPTKEMQDSYKKLSKEVVDSFKGNYNRLNNFIYSANSMQKNGADYQVIDEESTLSNISNEVNQEEYERWIDDTFGKLFKETNRGIRNDKEIFTPSGNRRKFNQLYDEYNLSNLVKKLTQGKTKAGQKTFFEGGFGKVSAELSNQFKSIGDIKNNEYRLKNNEEIKPLIEELTQKFNDDLHELVPYRKKSTLYRDEFAVAMEAFEDIQSAVQEFAGKSKLDVSTFKKVLNNYYVFDTEKIPNNLLETIIKDLNQMKDIPTDYFEAKPQRAVGFDEIDAIVIPKDVSKEVKQQLKDRGIKTIEYDRNNENERADILKSLNEYKFSKTSKSWQDYLEKNYKSEGTTTDLRDIRLPMKEKQEVKAPMKQGNVQQNQNNNTPGENINWNEIERPENNQKFRKHYRSIIESSNTTTEAKAVAKELMGRDTYEPETNKGQLAQADQRIMTSSPEVELQSLLSRAMNGEKISSVDIAVGERLIQYFSKTGNKQQLQDAIQATAMAGTSAGQTVQALSMLNHQTPQGQATWIQRSVDKMNKELAKKKGGTITTDADGNLQVINKQGVDITNKVDLFNLTPEMIDKIMNSENQEQMYKNIDEVYEELGQQVPLGTLEKIDSWRYFSMLANARTHIRNMVGNLAMGKTQRIKDKLAGGIEDVVSKFNPKMERTKTLAFADKKTKDFAKQDFKNMEVQSRLELNENKYNPQSRLQNARRTFKSNAMENTLGRLFNLNDKLLSAEDGIGLKAGYQKALADYITANKIDVDNITDAQLNKARNYAVQQAKEATFHQANAIASAVAQFENKNLATKLFTGAVLPFKKTPMNVAKAGMEYSPLQIAKSATVDLVNLRKGNISVNQYIDNLSKGMTGTGIALVGYALANAGILKASGGDDKDKEKYEEEQGKQSYSIQIAGKTYSLDWLAPTGIPLFIGAETHKLFNQEETEKSTEKKSEEDRLNQAIKGASNLLNAGATAINPMSEMSMISGLTSALSSYNTSDNLGSLGNIMTNAGKSYVNQFFPTLMGQVAKTGDEYERTTKSTATGTIGKTVDQTINQIKNKIPGLRQTLPIKTDIWGKELKQEVNLPLRAFNNFINPATVKEVSTDKVDMELNKLYEENHSSSLLPDILTKTVQLNKQTYRLSNKEYAEFTKNYGQTSHKLIENFIKTSDYNKLTQEQKETAISNIYSYAKEQNKLDYAKKVNETVKPSTLYTTMKEIEKNGGKQSEYLSYLAKTKGMSKESEKNKVLADSNYSNKTKEIIYTNGTGKDDNLYNDLLSKSNIDMTEYLKYKDKLSSKAFSADKDKNGKTVAGSAKTKVINYLNNNITGFGNRLLIAGNSYALQNSEKQKLAEYINSTVSTREERLEIYKQLDKNFTIKDGKVYMRVSKR